MSKLKKFADFFVTIEDDDADIPAEAGDRNLDIAAEASVKQAKAHPPKGIKKRVADLPEYDVSDDEFDIAALEAELAASRDKPAPKGSMPATQTDGTFTTPTFDDVYANNGLSTELSDEFTVYTVEQLLANPHLADLPAATKTASLMVALQARKVTVGEVIADARRRDQCLDQQDADLLRRLSDLEMETASQNAQVEDRINALLDELRLEIQSNSERLTLARETYQEWKRQKLEEEERLFHAISHLVEPGDENPVSRDE